MKPRVILSQNGLRIVRTANYCGAYCFRVEREDGRDMLGRTRWSLVLGTELQGSAELLLDAVGLWLVRRQKAARKARRKE